MEIEAFILIGGRSTRFGSDKAFFKLEGETLAARAARIVEMGFPGIQATFVAASEDQFGFDLISLEGPVIFDLKKGFGGWSGLDAALSHSRGEWTLVLACDLPFVTPEFLHQLRDSAREDIDAIVPIQDDGRLQPICALYRTEKVRPLVEQQMREKDLPPLGTIFDRVRTVVVDAPQGVLCNVNTRDDLN